MNEEDESSGRARNRERDRERSREWRERNREYDRQRKREYYQRNRERMIARQAELKRERYRADPEFRARENERSRQYGARNRERMRELNRKWYARNRERKQEYMRRYNERARTRNRERMREWQRSQSPEQRWTRRLRIKHAMHPEDWRAMRAGQDGRCYLCQELLPDDPRKVAVDHDHRCCPPERSCATCRRGLACINCNTAIGMARDNPALLRMMAAALEQAQANVDARMGVAPQLFALL